MPSDVTVQQNQQAADLGGKNDTPRLSPSTLSFQDRFLPRHRDCYAECGIARQSEQAESWWLSSVRETGDSTCHVPVDGHVQQGNGNVQRR
jgi:hypothetical protein